VLETAQSHTCLIEIINPQHLLSQKRKEKKNSANLESLAKAQKPTFQNIF
jgi:hypothetical protein